MNDRQFKYTIAEGYELPSAGKIYDKPVTAHVELRSMTARDEMKRQSPTTTQFKKMADIIEGCLIEKPAIHVYDMALGDYEYLLHRLRVVTYGTSYKMSIACPYCGTNHETTADLDQLQVIDFDEVKFNELREFKLPQSGDVVRINFQTPRMLDEIELKTKEMKRKYRSAEIEFDLLVLLKYTIDTVNGVKLDPLAAETYINNLYAADMTKIINNLDALNECIGVDSSLFIDCPNCGREVKTFFRFGPEFFRPSTI